MLHPIHAPPAASQSHPFQGVWENTRILQPLGINWPESADGCTKNKQIDAAFTGNWRLMRLS
jgi:hypothetical protein